MALVDWIISLGSAGAASNARRVCDERRAEEMRVQAFIETLSPAAGPSLAKAG